jgi:lipoate-protein ligase A
MQISQIRVIPCNFFESRWNMAADEYLLAQSEVPVLRFYQWSAPTLSFGRSNANFSDIDFSAVADFGIQGVVRQTGGKTVLHHKELTYSFITQNISMGILECYKKIGFILQKALIKLGVQSFMEKKEKNKSKGLICFQETSSYEIEVAGKKLVGSAQKRKKKNLLQHGSILLDIDFELWSKIWRVDSKILKNRATCLQELLGAHKVSDITSAIIGEFSKEFHSPVYLEDFGLNEKKEIDKISNSYYWREFESAKQKANESQK